MPERLWRWWGWVVVIGLWVTIGHAAVHTVATCTPLAVNAAVKKAVNGDTVQLPVCTVANWNATVVVTNKSLHLKGMGIAMTRLKQNFGGPMFRFVNSTNFRVSHISMEGKVGGAQQGADNGLEILDNGVNFAVHDNEFFHFGSGIVVKGNPTVQRGVIYNNTFHDIAKYTDVDGQGTRGYCIEVRGNGTATTPNYPSLDLSGTPTNVFIEDNTFHRCRHAVESQNGSRYVVRYNQFYEGLREATFIDAHGRTQAYQHGSRQWEIYHNTLTHTVPRFGHIGLRGGDGVIFNNVLVGPSNHPIAFTIEDAGTAPGCNTGCPKPCEDQTRVAHIWGNTWNGTAYNTVTFWEPCDSQYLQQGQEYFLFARLGYVPYIYPHPLRDDTTTLPLTAPSPPLRLVMTPAFP